MRCLQTVTGCWGKHICVQPPPPALVYRLRSAVRLRAKDLRSRMRDMPNPVVRVASSAAASTGASTLGELVIAATSAACEAGGGVAGTGLMPPPLTMRSRVALASRVFCICCRCDCVTTLHAYTRYQ